MSLAAFIFTALFGSPLAALHARAYHAIAPHPDAERVALVLTTIAADDPDPSGALALLIGIGMHETRFATVTQAGVSAGKGAVTWWQLEESRAETRALYLRDPRGRRP